MCGARAVRACKCGKTTYAVDSMSSRKIRFSLCAALLALSACGGRTAGFEDESFGGYPDMGGTGGGHDNGGSGALAGVAAAPVGGSGGTAATSGGGAGGVSGSGAIGGSAGFAANGGSGATGGFAGFGGVGAVGGVGGSTGGFGGSAGFGAIGGSIAGSAGVGGTVVQACVDLVATECAPCLCQTCAPSLLSCFSDLGCAVIFTCIAQTNCVGLGCLAPNACGKVIDEYGGPFGGSARKVFQLAACSVTSQNTCGCN